MSHFSVLVVGDVDHELAPFHEFECTGEDDEFVIDDDVTGDYEGLTLQDVLDEGFKPVNFGQEPDTEDEHKYGYVLLDQEGGFSKVVNRTNPNRKWDWYVLGGRWSNFLVLKNGNRADSAKKSEIDFQAMRQNAAVAAAEKYDKFTSIVAGREFTFWHDILSSVSDMDKAREIYHANPVVKDLAEYFGPFTNFSEFKASKEEFIKAAEDRACATFAAVKDRSWSEKGEMGWFGMSDDKMTQGEWNAQLSKMIDELPDDAVISIVDCHI